MEGLANFLTAVSVVLILAVLFSIRRAHIRVEYSVSWLGAAVVLLVLSRLHGVMQWMAGALNVDSPPLALLTLVGCVFLLVIFRLSVIISNLKDANIALAQRLAILEFHLQSVNEKIQTNG